MDGGGLDTVLNVRHGAVVEITGLTVRNGQAGGYPGGVDNHKGTVTLRDCVISGNSSGSNAGGVNNFEGTMTVERCTITGNTAGFNGGGIYTRAGTLTVIDSTISGNTATAFSGGGIGINGGTATVRNSTISDNTAGTTGGGIDNDANLTITGSTISGNRSTEQGGGIYNSGSVTITNSTISGNTADTQPGGGILATGNAQTTLTNATIANNTAVSEGGISAASNNPTLKNVLLAGNAPFNCAFDVVLTSAGHNLDSDGSCDLAGPGDLNNVDPMVGPLADNGGPTQTHALLPGSPAIDTGDNTGCPATDQRGFGRPVDGDGNSSAICDIGAYEYGAGALVLVQGDVDCSGAVDAVDALKILRYAVGLSLDQNEPCPDIGTEVASLWGDVDCSGSVDAVDALKILRYAVGLSVDQNEPCPDIGEPLS